MTVRKKRMHHRLISLLATSFLYRATPHYAKCSSITIFQCDAGTPINSLCRNCTHVDGQVISSIGNGLCVLLGIKRDDTEADIEVRKILNTKIFEGDNGKRWSASIIDKQYEILCVSQFTLYHVLKGNKLDFHRSMPAHLSEPFYNRFLAELGKKYKTGSIKAGKFGAMMHVHIENNGPVTLEIESPVNSVSRATYNAEPQDSNNELSVD